MIANAPLPPVRLPRSPGSSKRHTSPLPASSWIVQPSGSSPASKSSVTPVVVKRYPGTAHVAVSTSTSMSSLTSPSPTVTSRVLGR